MYTISFLYYNTFQGNDEQSELIIGDPDPAKYRDKIVWGDILQPTETGMWFTQLTGVLLSDHSNLTEPASNPNDNTRYRSIWLDECKDSNPCLALVDTGTSYITMPTASYIQLLRYMEQHVLDNGAASACFINTYGMLMQITLSA